MNLLLTQKNTVARHVLFWFCWWVIQAFLMGGGKSLELYLPKEVAMVSLQMFVVYINWFILYPYLFKHQKWILYGLVSIILVYTVFVISFSWIKLVLNGFHAIFETIPAPNFPAITWKYRFWHWFSASVPYSLALVGSLALKIYLENQETKADQERLKYINQKTEVTYLRNQINPHFLFNSLNNIHSLIIKDSHKAAAYTLALSEVMRHMLYDIKSDTIPLKRETACIQNIFDLIKLKKGGKYYGSCNMNIHNGEAMIAPLLICSILENGIKHSGVEYIDDVKLELTVSQKGEEISVVLRNSIRPEEFKECKNDEGIGLENLRKRLELTYPEKHRFLFNVIDGEATTELKLDLS